MPRTARASVGDVVYHVLNRGNGRARVFHKDGDFAAFVALMADAHRRLPMRVLAYALMPNHFHLVLWPRADGDLSRWMQWLLTAHVRRYHRHYKGSGHVWQGRFKAFPIQQDDHLLTVLRYVERNPLRAGLVKRAQDWPGSSLGCRQAKVDDEAGGGKRGSEAASDLAAEFLHPGPVPRGDRWVQEVNRPMGPAELEAIRRSVTRGAPYGGPIWTKRTAERLGLESSLRPRGRPRKKKE